MAQMIHSHLVASITDLKKSPMATVEGANGSPLAVLNRNQPVFYCVPPKLFEKMMNALEDLELRHVVKSRRSEKEIPVDIDDL